MERVLLADDHPLFREALRATINRVRPDLEVEEAESLAAAKEKLTTSSFALVLLDLKLTDSEGFLGLLTLRSEFPKTPVAIVSALLFTGPYPLIVWAAPLLWGIWIGRQDLRQPRLWRGLMLVGAGLAVAAHLMSELLFLQFGEPGGSGPGSHWIATRNWKCTPASWSVPPGVPLPGMVTFRSWWPQ